MSEPRNQRSGGVWRPLRLVLTALALFAAPAAGWAQTANTPTPAVLTGVTATEVGPGETRILLSFASAAPKFSLIGDASNKPSIALALSSRASSARGPGDLHGFLRSLGFDQNDTVLILNFTTAAAAQITAAPVGDKTLSIDLKSASPDQAAAGGQPARAAFARSAVRDPGEDGFDVVLLKYADVSEVVGLLTEGLTVKSNDSFVPYEPAFGSAGLGGGGGGSFSPAPAATATATNDPVGESVDDSIAVDRRLNAIILKGSPERIARLKQKIAAIDVPVESVLLETVFVELDETGATNVGLDFNNTSSQIAVATFQSGSFIPSGEATSPSHPLTSASLQAAIYAQVQKSHGRIVSKPRIAAQSGSTAKIITGDALPILTSIALSGVNAVSQQVQYVNVGVTLQIAPRVTSDGYVTSHVFCVVSSVTGTSQGYPTISQREAETSATVHDGETFVIGGLTEESDLKGLTKVPGLGDLPLAGELFRLHTGTRSKTELYIVVTPHIVRHGDRLVTVAGEPVAGP
jgi:general secretion pathway protein D